MKNTNLTISTYLTDWDTNVHNLPAQKIRQERAIDETMKMRKFNPTNQEAHFVSTNDYKSVYYTNTHGCSCPDFEKRQMPCKHMYKLDMKLKGEKHLTKRQKFLLITVFLGWAGVHRFMTGNIGTGILWFITAGLFCFGWFFDVFQVATGSYKNSDGKPIR